MSELYHPGGLISIGVSLGVKEVIRKGNGKIVS